jgi:hypothetical protein
MDAGKLAIAAALVGAFVWGSASAQTPKPAPGGWSPEAMAARVIATYSGMTCAQLDRDMEVDHLLVANMSKTMKDEQLIKMQFAHIVLRAKAAYKEYKSRCKGEPPRYTEAKKKNPTKYMPK